MSEQGGEPAPEPERASVVLSEGKPNDYRFRLTVSRSEKVNIGNYESKDVFVAISAAIDDPNDEVELENLTATIEGELLGGLLEAIHGRARLEVASIVRRIKRGDQTEFNRGPAAPLPLPDEGTRERSVYSPAKPVHDGVEPASRGQIKAILDRKDKDRDAGGMIRDFCKNLDKSLVKDLTSHEAADLLVILENDSTGGFRKPGYRR